MEKHPLTDIPLKMIQTVTLQFCSVFRLGHIIVKNLIIEAETPKEVYTVITEQLVASDNIHLFPSLIDLINSTGVISCIRDDFVKEIEEICISSEKIITKSPNNILKANEVSEECAEFENASSLNFDRRDAPNENHSRSLKPFPTQYGDNT